MDQAATSPIILLAAYCLLILLASLAGGWVPLIVRLTHTRMQVATSFVAGLMLGVGILHLLPHGWHELHSIDRTAAWLLAGFLIMFFIQRFFHFHHHDVPEESPEGVAGCCDAEHEQGRPESRPGPRHHEHTLADKSARHLSWGGAALGLTLHTLIDGIALGASVEVARDHREGGVLLGFGIFLVIILHKPFDALAISTLMASGGWSKRARHVVNAVFSLAIPAGVLLFYLGASQYRQGSDVFVGSALAFAAGTFICIAASDLLPELQFHAHDRGKLSVALIAGLLLAAVIGKFETSGHDRHHDAEEVESVGGNNHSSDARPAKKP